jgi:hypothetical protein
MFIHKYHNLLIALLPQGNISQLTEAFSNLFLHPVIKGDDVCRFNVLETFLILLSATEIPPHILQAINQSSLIQIVLDELRGSSAHEFYQLCQQILTAYASYCPQLTLGVDQLKPFASFHPNLSLVAREHQGSLKFNFVFETLYQVLKNTTLTLVMMTDCSSLLSMLFGQEEICDELLSCVLEITNQSLKYDDSDNDDHFLLPFLVDNGLFSYLTSFFTTTKKKNLKKPAIVSNKVVKAIQAIMRSDEKYIALLPTLNLSRATVRVIMKGFVG